MTKFPSLVHLAMILIMFGKAAIGSAGLTLALLGAANIIAAAISDTWVAGGTYLPYLVAAGAIAGGVLQITFRKAI